VDSSVAGGINSFPSTSMRSADASQLNSINTGGVTRIRCIDWIYPRTRPNGSALLRVHQVYFHGVHLNCLRCLESRFVQHPFSQRPAELGTAYYHLSHAYY